MMTADANRLRLKAARCLELAAELPTDAPAAEQLRLFAAEFAEMATQTRTRQHDGGNHKAAA